MESTSRNEAARPRNEQLVFPPVAKGHGHSDFPILFRVRGDPIRSARGDALSRALTSRERKLALHGLLWIRCSAARSLIQSEFRRRGRFIHDFMTIVRPLSLVRSSCLWCFSSHVGGAEAVLVSARNVLRFRLQFTLITEQAVIIELEMARCPFRDLHFYRLHVNRIIAGRSGCWIRPVLSGPSLPSFRLSSFGPLSSQVLSSLSEIVPVAELGHPEACKINHSSRKCRVTSRDLKIYSGSEFSM